MGCRLVRPGDATFISYSIEADTHSHFLFRDTGRIISCKGVFNRDRRRGFGAFQRRVMPRVPAVTGPCRCRVIGHKVKLVNIFCHFDNLGVNRLVIGVNRTARKGNDLPWCSLPEFLCKGLEEDPVNIVFPVKVYPIISETVHSTDDICNEGCPVVTHCGMDCCPVVSTAQHQDRFLVMGMGKGGDLPGKRRAVGIVDIEISIQRAISICCGGTHGNVRQTVPVNIFRRKHVPLVADIITGHPWCGSGTCLRCRCSKR